MAASLRLIRDEQQAMLAESARRFLGGRAPAARLRALRDSQRGWSDEIWAQMAELGWLAARLPEDVGGLGLGHVDLCAIFEEVGAELAPEPLGPTAVLAAGAIDRHGDDAQRSRWLPSLAAGEVVAAFAWMEPGRRAARRPQGLVAKREGSGWRLDGVKEHVVAGHAAEQIVVTAAAGEHTAIFVVDGAAEGLARAAQRRMDGRHGARLRFEGVVVDDGARLAAEGRDAQAVVEALLDEACVALSAELLGGAQRAFDRTLAWLRERHQFGVPIGSFQALQHRAAHLYVELAVLRSAVAAAARVVDEAPTEVPALSSLALAKAAEVFEHVACEAVQLHGGIGVTDEHDIGLYLKRARCAAVELGDASWHRDRWASLQGY